MRLTFRMSYRRRQTPDAGLADQLSKTERLAAVSSIRFVRRCGYSLSHTHLENKALSKRNTSTTIVGAMRSQKITSDNLESRVRMPKKAPHALHCTLRCRLALRNRMAINPPRKKTGQLNELLKAMPAL